MSDIAVSDLRCVSCFRPRSHRGHLIDREFCGDCVAKTETLLLDYYRRESAKDRARRYMKREQFLAGELTRDQYAETLRREATAALISNEPLERRVHLENTLLYKLPDGATGPDIDWAHKPVTYYTPEDEALRHVVLAAEHNLIGIYGLTGQTPWPLFRARWDLVRSLEVTGQEIRERVTVPRVLLGGPFAWAKKKRNDVSFVVISAAHADAYVELQGLSPMQVRAALSPAQRWLEQNAYTDVA